MKHRRGNPGEPFQDPRILEAIEAFRSGRDDPLDPALAPLAHALRANPHLAETQHRLDRLDAVLRDVIRDVPVPEGLHERIVARLSFTVVKEEPAAQRRSSRRRWMVSAASVVAASVLVGAFFGLRPARGLGEAEILDAAVAMFDATPPDAGQWLAGNVPESLKAFPLGNEVARRPNTRWREIEGLLGLRGVAYGMSGWDGVRATLYVVQCDDDAPELGPVPPTEPPRTTGGRAAAAWRSDGLLYVLVVEGDADAYRGFLNPGRPLT